MKDKWTKQDYIDLVNLIPINKNPASEFGAYPSMIINGAYPQNSGSNQYAGGNFYGNGILYQTLPNIIVNCIQNRRYAKGIQDVTKFQRAAKSKKGTNDPTTKDIEEIQAALERKIDWTPTKLLASKIDVAISMLISHERTFYARSKNIAHKEKREREQYKLAGQYVMQEAGLAPPTPNAPQTDAELELATNNLYLPFELQMKQAIEYALYTNNKWLNNVETAAARNLIIDDFYIVKVEIDEKNGIHLRVCDPINMYFKPPQNMDFSDVAMWAEVILVDEFQLREMDKAGEYTDKDFENVSYLWQAPDGIRYYAIMDFQRKGFASGKEFASEKDDYQVWRKGKWVVNSGMILDTGIVSGLPNNPCQSDFIAYCPSIISSDKQIVSLVQRAIPHIDQHYILGINIQKEHANAPITTRVIDPLAIAKAATIFNTSPEAVVAWGEKGLGVEMSPDIGMSPTKGFRIEYGGTSPAVNDYYQRQQIEENRIRDVMGIPAGIDGTLADPNQPVTSQKLAAGGAANSMVTRSEAMNFLFERTINVIASKIKYLVAAKRLGIIEETPYDQFFDEWAEDMMAEEVSSMISTEWDFEFRTMPSNEGIAELKVMMQRALDANQISITDYLDIVLAAGNDLEKANALLKAKLEVSRKQQEAADLEKAQASAKLQAEQTDKLNQAEMEKIAAKGEQDRLTDDNKAKQERETLREKIDLEHIAEHNKPEEKEEKGEMKKVKGSFQVIPRQYKNIPYVVAYGDDMGGLELIAPNEVTDGIYTDNSGLLYVYLNEENLAAQAIALAGAIMTQMQTGRDVSKLPKEERVKGMESQEDLVSISTEIAKTLSEICESLEDEEE